MKRLLLIIVFIVFMALPCFGAFTKSIDNRKTYKNAYQWTGKPKDFLLLWAQEVEDRLIGTTAVEFSTYTPTDTEPGTTAGMFYYDDSENKFKYYNGGSWVAIESGSVGNSLDGAYDVGRAITVDGGSVILTATDAADNVVLALIQSDTGSVVGQTITSAGTGALLTFTSNGTGADVLGTSSTWTVTKAGVATFVGLVTSTGDVTFTGSAANIVHDASADQIEFKDSSLLVFGSSDDISFSYDGSGDDLNILFDDKEIAFGVSGGGGDVFFHMETASTWVKSSEANDQLEFELADLHLSSDSQIEFEDDADGIDWTIDNATDETLLILPTETDGTQSINLGNATNTSDLRIFGEAASTVIFDATGDEVIFNAYDISLQDGDFLKFGDGDDFTMDSSTTKILDFTPAANTDDYEVLLGLDQSGVDLKIFGATTGEYWLFDASADSILPVCGNALYTMTDAEADQFKVNATGTVVGDAINFETTDGGILLNADGGANGDIELNSADDIILVTAGKLTITNTEAVTISGAQTTEGVATFNGTIVGDGATTVVGTLPLLEVYTGADNVLLIAESGTVFTNTGDGDGSLHTLPEASTALGMHFTFAVTAAQTMTINPKDGTDKIEGLTSAAGDAISSAAVGDCITLMAAQADIWVVVSNNNSNGNADAWVDAN